MHRSRRRIVGVALVAVATAAVGGCASKEPTLTSRFVRQGKPTTDLGGAPIRVITQEIARPGVNRPIVEVSRYSPTAADHDRRHPQLRQALEAAELAPTLEHYLEVARVYHSLGILDRAYDHLQLGAQIDPNSAAIHDARARLWRDWGLPQLGLSSAHRAMHAAPRSATARHTLGTVLMALGLRQEAERAFQEAVGLDPHAWYAWQNLCTLAMGDGRTKEAITRCQRAALEHEAPAKGR